jgi:hypothetical protein
MPRNNTNFPTDLVAQDFIPDERDVNVPQTVTIASSGNRGVTNGKLTSTVKITTRTCLFALDLAEISSIKMVHIL